MLMRAACALGESADSSVSGEGQRDAAQNLPDGRAGVPLALILLRLGSRGFIPL